MSLTSVIRYIEAKDNTATDGSGLAALAFGDFTAKYLVEGGTLTSLTTETITTLGTYQAPTSAAHIRIKELAASAPTVGIYEVHFHNTQVANTGKKLWLFLSATGAAIQPLELDLLPYAGGSATNSDNLDSAASNYSATRGLSGTALPAVASGNAGAVLISGSGTAALNVSSGKAPATIAAGDIANDALTAAALATDAVQEIRNAITGGAYALDTDANGRVRIVDGTGAGELDSSAGGVQVYDLTAAALAQINAEADTALADYDAPTYTELLNFVRVMSRKDSALATDLASVLTAINANLGSGAGGFANTTDALEGLRDRGDSAWITATGFSTHAAADVWAVGTRTLTALGFTLAASDLASGIITAAKFASGAIDAASTSADFLAEIQAAVTGGAYALNTDASGNVRVVDGTSANELNTNAGAIVQVDQLGTQAKADVNSEVVDTLATDTYAEPGQGTPASTLSLAAKINYQFKAWLNKCDQSSSLFQLYNSAGTTVDQKRTVSEAGGTVTLGAVTTGP